MTEKERAKQLATAHWSYSGGLLESAGVSQKIVEAAAYSFISAFEHAYGHAIEDERGGMFRPSIGEPLPPPAEVNAITRPCRNCHDEDPCGGSLRMANGDCLKYRPVIPDQQHPRKEG